MAAQIIYEHLLGSYLIYLFLLTEQGKQANETREYYISHITVQNYEKS